MALGGGCPRFKARIGRNPMVKTAHTMVNAIETLASNVYPEVFFN
jgi:hypothetical protein